MSDVGYRPLSAQVDLPALDREVIDFWSQQRVFERTLEQTADGPPWIFYEGPPTANGTPGTHHIEARVFKDVFPRYRTMRGYHVPRRAGWDCHGLPVELAVEKELGFTGKVDIERFGIGEFNARCRENVQRHVGEFLDHERAHGLLGRLRQRLLDDESGLHRERLVGPQADLRARPAGRGLPGRALLPPVRHDAVRPRGRPGLSGRRRPVGVRALPADLRPVGRPGRSARVDHDAVDPGLERRGGRQSRGHLCGRANRRRHVRGRRAAVGRCAR